MDGPSRQHGGRSVAHVRDELHIRGTFSVMRKFNCVTFPDAIRESTPTYFRRISLHTYFDVHTDGTLHSDCNKLENHKHVRGVTCKNYEVLFFISQLCFVLRYSASHPLRFHFRFIKRDVIIKRDRDGFRATVLSLIKRDPGHT